MKKNDDTKHFDGTKVQMQFTFTVAQIAKALTHLKSITECHLLLCC